MAFLNYFVIVEGGRTLRFPGFVKFACFYCEYANGLASWVKVVANRTEIYSCAIKHRTIAQGQDHQKNFYEYEKFMKK